jgi:hypothetical protein
MEVLLLRVEMLPQLFLPFLGMGGVVLLVVVLLLFPLAVDLLWVLSFGRWGK